MADYNFSTLNHTDFEKLVCDLLNNRDNSKAKFRSSKQGKDQGIDLLFSTYKNDFHTVVQVKHYMEGSLTALLNDLRRKERFKVEKLAPKNYIFVTSLPLSTKNKQDLKDIFAPYIKKLDDILGRDDLNDILRLHSEIEEKHFKLWFSSTVALQKILNYKLFGRSNEFFESEIKRKLRLFVNTKEVDKADAILKNNKFLIVTGEPGVGKTTLSEILLYKYISKDFALTVIYDDIKDIEHTLRDDDSPQIFYFDDFLGHTQAEIHKSKSAEVSIIKIISRIESLTNKYLILNTRKFILNSFLEESERLKNFKPLRSESKIELHSYTYGAKRRMLDNHIFESNLNEEQIVVLNKHAFFICTHSNFSPRHLEFFTKKLHVGYFNQVELENFIINNLDNPKQIWEHAYLNQITDYERFFLNSLYSMGGEENLEIIKIAFSERLNYEVLNNNIIKPINSYNNCISKLNGGFIDIYNTYEGINKVRFTNPSLEDFLRFFIGENNFEVERILKAAICIDQWYYFFKPFFGQVPIPQHLMTFFVNNYYKFKINGQDRSLLLSAIFFWGFEKDDASLAVSEILKNIRNWEFVVYDSTVKIYFMKFLQLAKSNKIINETISNFKDEFYLNLLMISDVLSEFLDLMQLFIRHYGFYFNYSDDFLKKNNQINELLNEVSKHLTFLFEAEIDIQYNILLKSSELDLYTDIYERLNEYKDFIEDNLFEDFYIDLRMFVEHDWNDTAQRNASDNIALNRNDIYDWNHEDGEYAYDEYESDYDYEKEKLDYWPENGGVELDIDTDLPF